MVHGPKHIAFDFGVAAVELTQQFLDFPTFGTIGTGAGILENSKPLLKYKTADKVFLDKRQGANNGQQSFKKGLGGNHGANFTRITNIHKKGKL